MKKRFTLLMILPILFACTPSPKEPSDANPEIFPTESVSPAQPVPEVSTTLPNTSETNATPSDTPLSSPTTITFGDNGQSFIFHVGDSFLLDLGVDIYEWTVEIDNQDVFALNTGETAPEGTQGFFSALNAGTATLTAVGDPLCRKVSPPCGVPTILFKATLTVE